MNKEKLKPIVKGIIKQLPVLKNILFHKKTEALTSRFCYSIWMRHFVNWNIYHDRIPENVAEFGPGNSFGIRLAALLSGCKHIYLLDEIKYLDKQRNLEIFEELTGFFKDKINIPDNVEYPNLEPLLEDYRFPANILPDSLLKEILHEDRLNAIRSEIMDITNPQNVFIKCHIPQKNAESVESSLLDFIYSQGVLEHIEDLDYMYSIMNKLLLSSGSMSHTIDFKSHGVTQSWNGHWTFNDFEWRIVKGGNNFMINRQPISKHLELQSKYNFKILKVTPVFTKNKLKRNQFSGRFRYLSEEDITTSGAYIFSKKE
jgi:hypothetical protein